MPDPAPVPAHYVVRTPSGVPHAVRRLAAAYDELADEVAARGRTAVSTLHAVESVWRGHGSAASRQPADVLAADLARVARALRQSADDLRHYAHRLEQAHRHHGWSIGRLVALGAVVTVGAAAVVVTMGAAAPAEAAGVAAAVEAAEAAAAAAGTAAAGAAADLTAWEGLLAAVRPLAPFVVPHVVSGTTSTALDAVSQLALSHRVDLQELEVSAAVGFAGSAAGSAAVSRLATSSRLAVRLTEAATWTAAGSAGDYAGTGTADPRDAAAYALTGAVAGDVRRGADELRLMWRLRVPQLPLGVASKREWRRLVCELYDAVDAAGLRDATIVWRGSSITGTNFVHGHPFDSRYRSDWDLALVDDRGYTGAVLLRVRHPAGEQRTFPLERARDLRNLGLLEVTRALSSRADRKVTWMVYRDLAAVQARRGGYLVVPRP